MEEPTIVTNWDSMPPEVYGNGEVFSTRVLAARYRKMEEALKEIAELPGARQDEGCNIALSALDFGT